MKNKNKIFPFLLLLLTSTVFLGLPSSCISDVENIIVSEIMYDPEGADSGHSDWIEIYNNSSNIITLEKNNFGIIDEEKLEPGGDGKHYKNCHRVDKDIEIQPHGFIVIAQDKDDFIKDYPDIEKNATYDSAFSLSSDGDFLHLSYDNCATFTTEMSYKDSWGGKNNGKTLEKIKMDNKYSKDDWQESFELGGTPGEKNSEKPKPKEYKAKLILNEILPHPISGEEEYIEIYNPQKEEVDLENYILRDRSRTGKYIFPKDTKIKSMDYLVVRKEDFKFALNDSGEESLFLYDPNEKLVDSMDYSGSRENFSWNFDGFQWHLSRFMTPGKSNQFETILEGKIKRDKKIYVNMYANFEAKTDKNVQKFTWDFGDGHKSYLKKTRHKYEKTGVYNGSLKITGDGEDNTYNFTVEVKNYSAPKIKIVSFAPNPKGKDSKEWITIKNKSKGKVNLINWSIATGWKNLYNHPVKKDFIIKAGQSKKLTKKICAFTLNNTKNKIELRDPSGDVVQKIKYDRSKNKIEEDETFNLVDKNWQWNAPENNNEENDSEASPTNISGNIPEENNQPENKEPIEAPINIVSPEEVQANLGKFTPIASWQARKENRAQLISYTTKINTPINLLNNPGKVLGIYTERNDPEEKHWAKKLLNDFLIKINSSLNKIINII